MTDLEITRLCAEASEVWKTAHHWFPTMTLDPTFRGVEIRGDKVMLIPNNFMRQDPRVYDPLSDDAQAMALVKNLKLSVRAPDDYSAWEVWDPYSQDHYFSNNTDLNRAICECVAKMQAAKPSPQRA